MALSGNRMRSAWHVFLTWLPRGQTLPADTWRVRHRAIVWLLLAHAVVFGVISVATGQPGVEVFINISVPLLGAYAASRPSLSTRTRGGIGAVALMLTAAIVVHLMNGAIEGHFQFFVMIPVVALYEDWVPFSLAVGVVLFHHGLMGTLAPDFVYDHHSAETHPWRWAFIHAAFFAAACVGSVINWKMHENARDAEQLLTARMRHQAHHDSLTGLPNRTQLRDHAVGVLEEADRMHEPVAVLLIDLDRFKEINDVLGHASGDELLARLGPVMAATMREGDLLARLGGDEFAAVLRHASERAAISVAKRLSGALSEPVEVDGIMLQVDASIGIATRPEGSPEDIDTLLRFADIAMYNAKRARCGYTVYSGEEETVTRERLNLLSELRNAVNSDEIVLHYQPKLALPDVHMIGVEALARWQHTTRGLIGPGEFIPAAESTGLIVPLTLRVLDMALAQMRVWLSQGQDMTIAVNLSPRCLAEQDLTLEVIRLLHRHRVPAARLEFEITENTVASDPDRALTTLTALHAAGVRISIDDFGTGYSSMSYLKRLPVSELKVDRSFIAGMLTDSEDHTVVRSLVELGHNLGLTVVAEGVEDQSTLEELADIGCDVAQGFHLGRPMPADELTAWLHTSKLRLVRPAADGSGVFAG